MIRSPAAFCQSALQRGGTAGRAGNRGNKQRMRGGGSWAALMAASALAALVSACAGVPRDASLPIDDPNEQFNRGVLRLNQAVLDPASNVVKQVPGPNSRPVARFGCKPEGAARSRQQHPSGPLQRRRDHRWPHRLQYDLRPWRIVRCRHGGGAASAERRFRPDPVRLRRPGRHLCERALLWPLDAARFGRRCGGYRAGSGRLGDGRHHHWLAVVGRRGRLGGDSASGPMAGGRERLDRLLQLPALRAGIRPVGPNCARPSACRPKPNCPRPPDRLTKRRPGHRGAGPASFSLRRKR